MRDRQIRRTIKRLYRLAKRGTGPEAANALRRAQELSVKHGITVDPNEPDEMRVPVQVTSAYWHQVLLLAITRAYDCRVLRKRSSQEIVIVGEGTTPVEAEKKFKYVTGQLWGNCNHHWLSWRVRQFEDVTSLEGVFRKGFLNSAADTAAQDILPGAVLKAPKPETPPDMPQAHQQVNIFEEVLAEERKEVDALINESRSHIQLARAALGAGAQAGKGAVYQCDWTIKGGELPQESTLPKSTPVAKPRVVLERD